MTSFPSNRSPGFAAGLAITAVLIASAVRGGLYLVIGSSAPFITFFPAVLIAALLGGRKSGWLAAGLATLASILWIGPLSTPAQIESAAIGLVLFVAISLWMVWLCGRVSASGEQERLAHEARLRLATIVESSDDAILSKALDGTIRNWNAAAARVYGYQADEIIGRSITHLVPPGLRAEQAAIVERLRRGERIEPFETLRLRKDGQLVRVLVTMSPLRDDGADVVGAVEIARDVSDRVRAEADLRRARSTAEMNAAQLRAVIGSMSEGVVLADAEGNLIEWNASALQTHGYSDLNDVRAHLANVAEHYVISDDDHVLPLVDWPMSRVLRGETFEHLELNVRRLDVPRDLILEYSGRPVYNADGTLALAVLTLHDVTEERRAQRALRQNAERLALAIEAGELGDWEWDAASDLVTLSPSASKIFGQPPDARMTREQMRAFLHEADRDRARQANEIATAERGKYDIEYRMRRGDGATVWIAAKGRGEYDADGRLVRMLGVVQDITARKVAAQAVSESREWLELAVSIAQMGTFQLETIEDKIVMNDTGRAMFGFGPDVPLSRDELRSRIDPADAERVRLVFAKAFDPMGPRRFEVEHRITRTDGPVRWLRVRGRTVFEESAGEPHVVRIVGTFLDVTDQKAAEQQREALLAAEQSARAAAEHAGRMKDEFLSTLSHELRTPLNAMLGWAQILRATPIENDDVATGLEVIERNARVQAQIIEDLLDMSRIISGKVRLEVAPMDLPQIITTAIETVRPTAAAKGVRLETQVTPPSAPVAGDGGRVQQILWNLLTNAIKFTPAGGQVRLTLRPVDGHVEMTVADTGEGIDAGFLPHVFDRFRQADATTTRRHGGLGLGLAIVKQLCELHGGSVRAESPGPGRGATFVVCLPTPTPIDAKPPEPAVEPRRTADVPPPSVSLDGVRVLVVDDEPDARAVVKRLLENCRATVTTAGSAAEAIAALTDGLPRPHVLVSDVGMPGEDGYALIGRVRQLPDGGGLPAVALTAYARVEDRARALGAGFQAHLTKPVEPASLIAVVADLAGRAATG